MKYFFFFPKFRQTCPYRIMFNIHGDGSAGVHVRGYLRHGGLPDVRIRVGRGHHGVHHDANPDDRRDGCIRVGDRDWDWARP